MKKILFPIGSFYPAQCGGPSNSVYWIAKELQKQGMADVTVVTTTKGIDKQIIDTHRISINKESTIDGLKVYYFTPFLRFYFSIRLIFWVLCNIRKYDIVHLTSIFDLHSILIALMLRVRGKRVIISPRGELKEKAMMFSSLKKKLLMFFIKNWFYKNSILHYTSLDEKENSVYLFSKNDSYVIPNMIAITIKNSIACEKKHLLYIGRLHPIKAIDNLITAYSRLQPQYRQQFPLLIVGTGDEAYKNSLVHLVNELRLGNSVSFVGHLTGQKKDRVIQQAKVVVLPSQSENFANVVLEAIIMRTYVITSIYTPWEILQKLSLASWIDNRPEYIAAEIEKVLSWDSTKYNTTVESAYKYIVQEYEVKNNIKKYMLMYGGK